MANKKNFAIGVVDVAPSPATSGNSLTLETGHGDRMPAVPFSATAYDPDVFPMPDNLEKIYVTARTSDTITFSRAQGGTTARSIQPGWVIVNAIYEEDIPETFDDLTDGSTNKAFTSTEKTKLAGIATGATANDTDANLKNRANHTGTQASTTISDFTTAVDARITAGLDDAQTFDNKRINPRVSTTASTSSLTPDISAYDQYNLTALAANLTVNAPTGSPQAGQKLLLRIKDNGTSRTITLNAIFRAVGLTIPTATTINKTLYLGCVYNVTDTKWDVIAIAREE